MSTPKPGQLSFEEREAIATDPELRNLLRWYPDQQDKVLAAWRRRHRPFARACSCPRCAKHPHPQPSRRPKTPSAAGQYREQVQR